MPSRIRTFAIFVAALLAAQAASATLIGDIVGIEYMDPISGSSMDFVTVDGGLEYTPGDGSNLSNTTAGQFPVWESIDIGDSYIEIRFLFSINPSASPAIISFVDLDWIGSTGFITGVTLTSEIPTIVDADLSFTADSITLDMGNQNAANYDPASVVRLDIHTTHVPLPSTFALMGLGLVGVGVLRRRKT